MVLGSIEAGGTKIVCAVGNEQGEIYDSINIPTETPEITIPKIIDFFQQHDIQAVGIGSFGPIDIKKNSKTFGYILQTPKLAWRNYPFLDAIRDALNVPCAFTTDVNIAAIGEYTHGAAKDVNSCLYITVGTGVGAGAIIHGKLLEGISHPEMGHITVKRHPKDSFEGSCPIHQDCLEGLAAGPAIEKRWGKKGIELSDREEVWELEAYYLAQAIAQYIMILVPEKVILGGGVANQASLIGKVREKVHDHLKDYFVTPEINEYIVTPELKNNAGIVGGLVFADRMVRK